MILIRHNGVGLKRAIDLSDMYAGYTAMLVGGAPCLREQPIELLEQRGVITMAMNNAAQHFRPTMWSSSDHPDCYQPRILTDPTIMKFGSLAHVKRPLKHIEDKTLAHMPNMYFYMTEANVPWDEYLGSRKTVPWYNNTLFVSIHILYQLGVRTIILAGSDFGFSKDGSMYAHKTELGDLERKWNLDLYNSLARELRLLKPVFEKAGLKFYDSSKNSRIGQTYPHISLEEAVDMCLNNQPKEWLDSKELPHCSKFASKDIQERIANWPGYQMVGEPKKQEEPKENLAEHQVL